MKYWLIKGSYHVVGQSPDADSVKFKATRPELWQKIDTENRDALNRELSEDGGVIMLRLQGIDALETHYSAPTLPLPVDLRGVTSTALVAPRPASYKQLADFGLQSTNKLLELLGVTQPIWRRSGFSTYIRQATITGAAGSVTVTERLKDHIPGYIVASDVEMNGRPLSWVFVGTTTLENGASISTDTLAAMLEQSANYQLVRLGMVYPYFFMTLSAKLRTKLVAAAQLAESDAQPATSLTGDAPPSSIWSLDQSTSGIDVTTMTVITDEKALYPYIFRKVCRYHYRSQMEVYWAALRANATSMTFPSVVTLDALLNDGNPYVFVISDQDFVRLSDVVEISGSSVRMKKAPYDLVFLS